MYIGGKKIRNLKGKMGKDYEKVIYKRRILGDKEVYVIFNSLMNIGIRYEFIYICWLKC